MTHPQQHLAHLQRLRLQQQLLLLNSPVWHGITWQ
jgi:hypothetical protein